MKSVVHQLHDMYGLHFRNCIDQRSDSKHSDLSNHSSSLCLVVRCIDLEVHRFVAKHGSYLGSWWS